MAWEENSRICINMQLIAILSRTGVIKPRRYFRALAMQHRRICNVNVCWKQHAAADDAECSYPHQGQEI